MIATPAYNRRSFIGMGFVTTASIFLPGLALAGESHAVRIMSPHTGETFNETIVEDGKWIPEAHAAFDHFARDYHLNKTIPIHTRTIEILIKLQALMDSPEPFQLLSGYRTPYTNAHTPGAVPHSYHIQGAALDLHQPGRSTWALRKAALSLPCHGGVGFYPGEHFVHIDCGPKRYWSA